MIGKNSAVALPRLKLAMLLYFIGLVLISIVETIATYQLEITTYLFFLTLLSVVLLIAGGSKAQEGFNVLKKVSAEFRIPAALGPFGVIAGIFGVLLILVATPALLLTGYALSTTLTSGAVYLPTPVQASIALYNLLYASHIPILIVGLLALAIGVLACILATSLGIWRLGGAFKNRNLKISAILLWLPAVGLLAFLITYIEIGNIVGEKKL